MITWLVSFKAEAREVDGSRLPRTRRDSKKNPRIEVCFDWFILKIVFSGSISACEVKGLVYVRERETGDLTGFTLQVFDSSPGDKSHELESHWEDTAFFNVRFHSTDQRPPF